MQGPLTPDEMDAVLQEATYGRLGCHADGRTYIVPIAYAYDGKRLLCHSGEGLKVAMMRKNPEVCFEVEIVESLGNWRCVIAWGTFVELHGLEAAEASGLLFDRLSPQLESAEMPRYGMRSVTPPDRNPETKQFLVYSIEITEKTGRFERIGD